MNLTHGKAVFAIGLGVTLLGVARADNPTPFTTVLRAHFEKWAGDGVAITPEQLDRLMKQQKIHGEPAAVLAAMKRTEKDPETKQLLTWTMKRIEDYEAQVAEHHRENSYDKHYEKALAFIKADPHTLYADGAPRLSSIHQARGGDCWLLATIGGIIHRDPHELRSLLSDDGDRIYSVHLAYHTFKVHGPTDAEIGAYTSDKAEGDWLYVLEHAVGQYREDFNNLHHVAQANDDALVGGTGALALRDICGRESDHLAMTPDKPQHDLVRKTLTRALKERRLVILGTTHDEKIILPHGIAHKHAMALIGWDPAADTVTIWNPWGNNSEPKGTAPNDGYKTVNGVFTMPLTDFTRSFANICVENDKTDKPKK